MFLYALKNDTDTIADFLNDNIIQPAQYSRDIELPLKGEI